MLWEELWLCMLNQLRADVMKNMGIRMGVSVDIRTVLAAILAVCLNVSGFTGRMSVSTLRDCRDR